MKTAVRISNLSSYFADCIGCITEQGNDYERDRYRGNIVYMYFKILLQLSFGRTEEKLRKPSGSIIVIP
jgi:hypothetical protein